jgi:hypothetical protein
MDQFVKRITTNLMKKDTQKGISILVLIIFVFFFDVLFLNKTLSSIQVPGVLGTGPYGYTGKYTHRAFIDPGGSTWGPAPHTRLVSQQYKEGKFPLWNPYQGIGQPLAANMDSNAFNPLRILLYWHPSPYFWNMFLLFRLLLAGIFAYLFMRSIQISHLTALFTSILFMFCGYFIFSIDMHHLDVEIFLPFVFLCLERIIQNRGNLNWVILCGIGIFFTIVGGQPQSTFLILAFASLYYFFRVFAFRENWGLKLFGRYLALFVTANLIGFALSAILLFPSYEFWRLSWNNHDPRLGHVLGLDFDRSFRDFISFIIPYYLGPIHGSWLKEYDWHCLTRGYWGVTAVFFALLTLGQTFKARDRRNYFVLFFAASLILMVAKLYGFPPVNWIGKLPVADMINYGKYMGPLMAFCCAVLAGLGLERLAQTEECLPSLKKEAKIIILFMLCTFFYFYQYMTEHSGVLARLAKFSVFFQYSVRNIVLLQTIIALFFLALLMTAYVLFARRKVLGSLNFQRIVIAIALLELFIYIPNPGILKKRNERFDIFNKAPYLDFLHANLNGHRVVGVDRVLYPDFGSAFAIGDIRVLDALWPKRYTELMGNFFTMRTPPDRFTGDEGIDFKKKEVWRILDLLGVRCILSSTDLLSNNIIEDIINRGKIVLVGGQPHNQWINTSSLNINGIDKKILFAHAPAKVEYKVKIPTQSQLQFSIGLVPGSWSPDKGDGVLFEIYLQDDQSQKSIFSQYIDPKNRIEDRKWFDYFLDLTPYGGKEVLLTFATLPGINNSQDNNSDWSAWGDIRLTDPAKQERLNLVYNKEIKIYENPRVFPRAFVSQQYVVQKEKDRIFETLKDESFDLRSQIVLEEEIPEELKRKLAQSPQGEDSQAVIKKYEVDQVECIVRMKSPGFLVLSDLYYPGWNAYVDGKKEKIYQTDYILRSVFLDAGAHDVKFIYEPHSFKIGVWISGVTAFFIFILLLGKALLRQRKRKRINSGTIGKS